MLYQNPDLVWFYGDWEQSAEDVPGEDREAVKRMYQLALKLVEQLTPSFQIIMTDHANINETWFQDSIVGRWRGGRKLVPSEWSKR